MTILYEEFRPHAEYFAKILGSDIDVVSNYIELTHKLRERPDEVLVVFGPGTPLSEAVTFASDSRMSQPHLGVLLLRPRLDVGVMTEALRAGVREVLDAADAEGIVNAGARSVELSARMLGASSPPALRVSEDGEQPPPMGRVITVFAAKGGCGKTTSPPTSPWRWPTGGPRRVCLIDLDLAFGDVAIMLQLAPDSDDRRRHRGRRPHRRDRSPHAADPVPPRDWTC